MLFNHISFWFFFINLKVSRLSWILKDIIYIWGWAQISREGIKPDNYTKEWLTENGNSGSNWMSTKMYYKDNLNFISRVSTILLITFFFGGGVTSTLIHYIITLLFSLVSLYLCTYLYIVKQKLRCLLL